MDRQLVYSGAIPLDTDILSTNLDSYIGLAKLSAAVLGVNQIANGLAVTPTAPATLSVQIAAGEIYSLQFVDPTAYGSLPIDNVHQIVKQGINLDPTTLTLTAPATSGYSQNYLIQYGFQEVDGDSTVLEYYNAANPADPFSGPGNTGDANYVIRQDQVYIVAKAGIAAPSGTQLTPAPDAGFVGGYVVTVANGSSTITSANIVLYSANSFINETLTQKISQATADIRYAQKVQIQAGTLVFGIDSGTVNSIITTISPNISSYSEGMEYNVYIANTNTGATVANFNGLGNINVKLQSGSTPYAGAIKAGMVAKLFFDGTNFQLMNPIIASPSFTAPQLQTYTSGSGTYTVPSGALYLKVWGIGGGGGGGAAGSPGALSGTGGGTTTFGSMTAYGGNPGGGGGGAGGTATGGSLNYTGTYGGVGMGSTLAGGTNLTIPGGIGGSAVMLLQGGNPNASNPADYTGNNGIPNTGGGGSGGGAYTAIGDISSGGGGGGGGSFYALIPAGSLASSYSYSIGAGGTGGVNSIYSGGNGGSGFILIEAYFQ